MTVKDLRKNEHVVEGNFGEVFLAVIFDPVEITVRLRVGFSPVGVTFQVPDLQSDQVVLQIQLSRRLPVFENTYFRLYVFFRFQKTLLFTFFKCRFKKRKKSQKVSSLLNVYRNFGLKTPRCYGYLVYRHLSHTVLSCIVSCVHTSEQDV